MAAPKGRHFRLYVNSFGFSSCAGRGHPSAWLSSLRCGRALALANEPTKAASSARWFYTASLYADVRARHLRDERGPLSPVPSPIKVELSKRLYQGAQIMTHRDRLSVPPSRRKAAGDAGVSSRFFDALRRGAEATGPAAFQASRTASRPSRDAPASPRRALLAESPGKPSLRVIIYAPWY